MTHAPVQQDRNQALWLAYVNGADVDQLAGRFGLHRSSVYRALAAFRASIPEDERRVLRDRALDRLEDIYRSHADRARTSTRSATIARQVVMDQARLLGLVMSQVEHSGQVQHEHTGQVQVEPLESVVDRIRARQGLPAGELGRVPDQAIVEAEVIDP